MGAIQDLARKIAATLKDSPENKAFQAARQKVRADKRTEKLISDFRTRQYEISAMQVQGRKPDAKAMQALEKLGQELQASPLAREYFEAEARLGQLWVNVQRILGEAVGMKVDR